MRTSPSSTYHSPLLCVASSDSSCAATREKSINTILDYVSLAASIDLGIMEQFYAATNVALEEARNERLGVKTDLKLARLWLARREWARLEKTIRGLKEYCLGPQGQSTGLGAIFGDDVAGGVVSADQNKGTILMEVFATEIQMYSELKDYMKLKEVYNATLQVKNAIPHPRISGIIRECGGKMHMSESNWTAAQQDFYQAFNAYDEAGSPSRISVLKYLVLAVLFMGSHIDPFDSREMRPYKTDAQIAAMLQLAEAYRRNDALQAENVIKANGDVFHGDSFITDYIELLLKYLRHQYILDTVGSYTRLDLHYLAKQLNVPSGVAENLVRTLILDGRLQGRIDQVNETLELDGPWCASEMSQARTQALQKWLHTLEAGNRDLVARVARLYGHEARVREERSNPSLYR